MMFILVGNLINIYYYYYAMLLSYYMLWGKNSIFNIADLLILNSDVMINKAIFSPIISNEASWRRCEQIKS